MCIGGNQLEEKTTIKHGRKFWNMCTHDVTHIARHHAFSLQARYEHEKTKKGQMTPSPHTSAPSECKAAQIMAEVTARFNVFFVKKERIQKRSDIIKVSKIGPRNIMAANKYKGGPSNCGAVSSFMIPAADGENVIASDGIRLMSPARRMYFRIGTSVLNKMCGL